MTTLLLSLTQQVALSRGNVPGSGNQGAQNRRRSDVAATIIQHCDQLIAEVSTI
jgi:hypothetical protein